MLKLTLKIKMLTFHSGDPKLILPKSIPSVGDVWDIGYASLLRAHTGSIMGYSSIVLMAAPNCTIRSTYRTRPVICRWDCRLATMLRVERP
jgi:hypothetical protein